MTNGSNTHTHRVSVVIPTHDRCAILPRALDSVLAQTWGDFELIVVDDGSADGTAEMVARDYPSVRLIQQANQGVSAARNTGTRAAGGEWIAFLDSDDAWLPKKLEYQLKAIDESSGYRLCHTEEIWIRRGKRVNQMKKHAKTGGRIYQKCLPLCCISPSSSLLHHTLLEELGGFDESFVACEDYDLWLRVTAREAVLFVDEPLLYRYGGHEDQLSRKYWGMDRFRIRALEKILQEGCLSTEDEYETRKMLVEKLEILINGAKKRDNRDAVQEYLPRLEIAEAAFAILGEQA